MSRESGNATKFSLMSFNIAHGRGLSLYQGFHSSNSIRKNLEKIARIVREHSPDIVAFQEIDQSSHWNKHIDLLKHIQDETGYPHSKHGIHNTRFGRKPLCYGNAFLSKHPILNCQVHPFGEKTVGEKGFMEAQVQTRRPSGGHHKPPPRLSFATHAHSPNRINFETYQTTAPRKRR